MTPVALVVAAFLIGWALWTFAEYALHRFLMHEQRGRNYASRQHLEHHARSGWRFETSSLLSWIGIAVVGGGVWIPVGWVLAGPLAGLSLGIGWAFGYFFYEYLHAAAHLRRPPVGRYERWLRLSHFHHHFGAPMRNHGVTTNFWDRVFGTYDVPGVVRVPRRMAMPWLLDEDGAVRAEFAPRYQLVGRASARDDQGGRDHRRAFANLAPEA